MIRIFALCLAVMVCLSGCGGAPADETTVTTQSTATTNRPAEKITLDPVVVYDDDDIKITATGFEFDGFLGAEVKILLENDTDRNVALSGDYFIVNGITVSGFLFAEAAAGKKTNDTISLYADDLKTAGIDTVAQMQFPDARIVDSDSFETIQAVPFSLKTSASDNYVQIIDDSGSVIFEGAGVTVTAKQVEQERTGSHLQLFVKNAGDQDVILEAVNVSVNGFTVDAWLYETVYRGTVRFGALELFSDSLEENGITDVREISFRLRVLNAKDFDTLAQSGELTVSTG